MSQLSRFRRALFGLAALSAAAAAVPAQAQDTIKIGADNPDNLYQQCVVRGDRTYRITGKRSISVKVSGLKISVNGNKATARFRQDYKADTLSISSGKRLELVRNGGNWVIVKESTGS